ncbi:rCG24648, isoform CRA_b [Rattus norvegicus]|uniref:RCG24648, isoform CRA_b n=1 Tax=Rattus norvegicus TaxID=10116 RepID=A6JC06_RAT|nr:rCG24648, isoform CRA_b [Rattus norvegicus]
MWKAAINVSSLSYETIYRANSSCAFTPSPGEGHIQRSAQPGAAASACFSVRCFPTLLSFGALPNNRTQRSPCESRHARPGNRYRLEDHRSLPGWKIRSERFSEAKRLMTMSH